MPQTTQHPKLFLIDISSFIFRAFFAIRGLSTSKGLPTNAVYGVVTMLLNVLEKHKPDYVACVFDTAAPTFRKEIYKEYKSNRGAPPDDLLPQFDYISRAVDVLGLAKFSQAGFEADDLIATLVKKFKDTDIVIVTGDKDLMQLVDKRCRILDTMKNVEYGPKEVKEKLGVDPSLVTDYLGLIGDSSDNIPGVPGIGPKTAVELLSEYGDIEGVLKSTAKMKPGKRREVLEQNAEIARLSKQLATVKDDVEGECDKAKLNEMKRPNFETDLKLRRGFVEFLKELEFKTLAKKYETEDSATSTDVKVSDSASHGKMVGIQTEKEWHSLLEKLDRKPVLAFDTETRGERTTELEMVGLSLCADPHEAYYIPFLHHEGKQLSSEQVLKDFVRLSKGKTLVAQNLKYDYKVFLASGIELESENFFDTMIAHYLLQPEEKHGLDVLATKYLGATIGDFKAVLGDKKDFSEVSISDAVQYSGLDAWSTLNLHQILKNDLEKQGDLYKLFKTIEMPVVTALSHMEWNGIKVDPDVLDELSKEYSKELEQTEKDVFDLCGTTFNLNSPKQLSEILFTKLGLPALQKTKTGFSTDVSVLEKLAPLHPVPALMVRYRELNKLKNTYVDVLPGLIEKDGRVHASFNQAVTATGRLSSSDPNLQNIPIKGESGRKIRKAFIAGRGHELVGADYSQIELRLVADLSGDEALIEAFQKKQDVHRATAAEIFHVALDKVSDQQRNAAKAINFGLIYGKTAFGLAQELNISRTEAQQYIEAYFKRYSGVKKYMDRCMNEARETKVAKTMFGRIRHIKDIDSKNVAVRNNAERMAINTPVQGTAADIMKLAMIRAHQYCKKSGVKMVLQVHDELVLDVPESLEKDALTNLKTAMENAVELSVPLEVSIGHAKNWMAL